MSQDQLRGSAVRFIVALGIISLLSDTTYEGGRSITGPFMGTLGASAAVIGIVAGFGELAGYALRLVSGMVADRTRAYWALVLAGTIVNLGAVPLLAFAQRWELAALLMILERAGRAIRTPSRDVMLSQAAHLTGRGWGFGLHEALDRTGAFLGPILVAFVFARTHRYAPAFAMLAIPFGLALAALLIARFLYPNPNLFERPPAGAQPAGGLSRGFWWYVIAAGLIAAGIADFALIAYHFQKASIAPVAYIPLFYSAAMGTEAIVAFVFGHLFDKVGVWVIVAGVLLSAIANPLLFLGGFHPALAGIMLWGAGTGAQNSALRASISNIVAPERRGSAFGIYNTVYGLLWFAGSATIGLLYGRSVTAVVIFAITCQLLSIPFLLAARRHHA